MLIVALSLFTSCIHDDIGVDDVEVPLGYVKVNFDVPEMSVATRGTSAENYECALKDVHLIFFNEAGAYVAHSHADVKEGQTSFMFKIPDKLNAETDYKTLVVGNSHNYTPKSHTTFDQYIAQLVQGSNYDRVRKEIVAEGGVLTKTSAGSSGLPMYGTFTDNGGIAIPFRFSGSADEGYSIAGKVSMNRLVSRVDINNLMANRLVITKVKLGNRRNGAYYFNHSLLHPEVSLDASYTPMGGVEGAETDMVKTQSLTGELYCFSNMVPITIQNDEATTFVLIEGYYQDGDTPNTSTLSYYRVNLADMGRPQQLLPNHIYKLTITNVAGAGAATEDGAISATAPKIGYSINDEWIDENDNTLVSDNKGNTLSISRANLQFAYEKESAQLVRIKAVGPQPLQWHAAKVSDDINYPDHDKFEISANGTSGIAVVPVSDNTSPYMYRARIKVWATGGTTDTANPPTTYIDVFQFNKSGEMRILTVDNQVGTIEATMPGEGGTMRFVINTGSRDAGYKATWQDTQPLNGFIDNNGVGNNGSTLTISVPANTTDAVRHFSVVVKRVQDGVTADTNPNPVTIEFTQPITTKLFELITPLSEDPNNPTWIEGFAEYSSTNNIDGYSGSYKLILSRAIDYTKHNLVWRSNFLLNDLRIAKSLPTFTEKNQCNNNITGSDLLVYATENLYVLPIATGPGDPPIVNSLTLKVVDKISGKIVQSKDYYIGIKTSCDLGEVAVETSTASKYVLLADRNVGVPLFKDGIKTQSLFTSYPRYLNSSLYMDWMQPSYGPGVNCHNQSQYVGLVFNKIQDINTVNTQSWYDSTDDSQQKYYFYNRTNISKWLFNYDNSKFKNIHLMKSKGRYFILSNYRKKEETSDVGQHQCVANMILIIQTNLKLMYYL